MSFEPTVVLVDADNTLWDTDAVYREAQLALLAQVESQVGHPCPATDKLAFVRAYDQALAQAHHLHLRYPSQLLVRALEAGLANVTATIAAKDTIAGRRGWSEHISATIVDSIVAEFVQALKRPPTLLPTVHDAVNLAQDAGLVLYVVTEGRIERQKEMLDLHELRSKFDGVWELTKTADQFARLKARFSRGQVVVIGDQYDRDIAPARAGGCLAVLVPSRFAPSWNEDAGHESANFVAANLLLGMAWCVDLPVGTTDS